jgi:phosphate acyltransferase
MEKVTIAIDAMGGDYGVIVTVPAALSSLEKYDNLRLILVGSEDVIKEQLKKNHALEHPKIIIKHTSQVVAMDESPSAALRYKKDSSMRVAINLVKDGVAQACVSAGNTGALMATAKFVLKMLPGVDRPALTALVPTYDDKRSVRVLDLGANVDCCADHLYQFAVMGSVLVSAIQGLENPKIGLLNIGGEDIKGNDQVKQAAKLLSESKYINYCGYVEADNIFEGVVDVVICDGFVGNVALKAMEGIAKLFTFYMKKAFKRNLYTWFAKIISIPALLTLKKELDPGKHNGASFLGLQGIVIKSHGGANIPAFANAIKEAVLEVKNNVPQLIGDKVSKMLEEN